MIEEYKIDKDQQQLYFERIKNSLYIVATNLSIKYRVFGSVLAASLLGKPQRKLGDIDILIDNQILSGFVRKLKQTGFEVVLKKANWLGLELKWIEAIDGQDYLGFTIFPGKFINRQLEIKISGNLKIVVPEEALQETQYTFGNICFIGIPAEYAYLGSLRSQKNPKRKYDLVVFESKVPKQNLSGLKDIEIWYRGKKIQWLYPFATFIQNFLGPVFVKLGKHYDFWMDMSWGIKEEKL